MFQYSADESTGTIHLVVIGSSNFDDFQSTFPAILEKLKSHHFDKLLLEVQNLDAPSDFVDPDFDFMTINEIKSHISKFAVAAPKDMFAEMEPLMEVVRNANKSVKYFLDVEDARAWLAN